MYEPGNVYPIMTGLNLILSLTLSDMALAGYGPAGGGSTLASMLDFLSEGSESIITNTF